MGLAFAPDGRLFFTERPGRVRIFQNGQLLAAPALDARGCRARWAKAGCSASPCTRVREQPLRLPAYTARLPGGSRENRVVRYREVDNTLGEPAVILDSIPAADIHDGARVRFGPIASCT